jgi:hypothetical protein
MRIRVSSRSSGPSEVVEADERLVDANERLEPWVAEPERRLYASLSHPR